MDMDIYYVRIYSYTYSLHILLHVSALIHPYRMKQNESQANSKKPIGEHSLSVGQNKSRKTFFC